jgi:hypothetical protein
MEQVKTQEDQAENGRRFSQEQYDMLLRCSEKKDMTEWNNWRDARRGDDICLDGASFYEDTEWKGAFLRGANLKHNPKTGWDGAVYLRNAKLQRADLEGAELVRAHLEQADLWLANVKGVDMGHAHLQGTQANMAVVDEGTLLWQCKVDKKTNFSGVGLGNVRIDSATKQLLEYNIRRKNWENWYGGTSERKWVQQLWKALTVPVRLFWLMSDYGHSTWTVFFWFGALAIVFAVAYWNW